MGLAYHAWCSRASRAFAEDFSALHSLLWLVLCIIFLLGFELMDSLWTQRFAQHAAFAAHRRSPCPWLQPDAPKNNDHLCGCNQGCLRLVPAEASWRRILKIGSLLPGALRAVTMHAAGLMLWGVSFTCVLLHSPQSFSCQSPRSSSSRGHGMSLWRASSSRRLCNTTVVSRTYLGWQRTGVHVTYRLVS